MNDDDPTRSDDRIRDLLDRAVRRAPSPPTTERIASTDARSLRTRVDRATHSRRSTRWSRSNWVLAVGAAALVVAIAAGTALLTMPGGDEPATDHVAVGPAEAWEPVAPSPLSPRTQTTLVWTGEEVLVLGGDTWVCPPGADCAPPTDSPLRDGAAYNPATNAWRRIADAPVAFSHASVAVSLDAVYVSTWDSSGRSGGSPATLMRYALREDAWSVVEHPGGQYTSILAWGPNRIVAQLASNEDGPVAKLRVLDLFGSDTWTDLPDAPLRDGYDAVTIAFEGYLYQFDHALDHAPDEPPLTRVARYNPSTGWQRYGDLSMLAAEPWFRAGDSLLAVLQGGSADGGATNNWGRRVPYGGMVDTQLQHEWSPLPPGGGDVIAGAFADHGALYMATSGSVLDVAAGEWITMRDLGHTPAGVVAAGRDAFAFGGVDWDGPNAGIPLNGAWIWRTRDAPSEPTSPGATANTAAASTVPPATKPSVTPTTARGEPTTIVFDGRSGGCGDASFYAFTADNTAAIRIYVNVRDRSTTEVSRHTIDLAAADDPREPTASLLRGDLAGYQPCNDYGGGRVDSETPIVRGEASVTLEPTSAAPADCGVHGEARLTNLAAGDGTRIDDLTIATGMIGCYAG